MSDNLRIWNAVAKTDPAHTKKVEFGRKFTSIDAHWQIMQATHQFGPIGEGWRYEVAHSIERLSDEMVLAIADVKIFWRGDDDVPRFYGPIRATCEMWSKNEKKGRMEVDEDAPKKAMTDALTKGLSHLGFSADVFLGLFDDNRYVQKVKKEFEQTTVPMGSHPGDFADEARKDGLTTETRSTYQVTKDRAAIAALCKTAQTAITMASNRIELKAWWNENKGPLREKLPDDDFAAILASVEEKRDSLPAIAA